MSDPRHTPKSPTHKIDGDLVYEARVASHHGGLVISGGSGGFAYVSMPAKEALALARWIVDTFSEPEGGQ